MVSRGMVELFFYSRLRFLAMNAIIMRRKNISLIQSILITMTRLRPYKFIIIIMNSNISYNNRNFSQKNHGIKVDDFISDSAL